MSQPVSRSLSTMLCLCLAVLLAPLNAQAVANLTGLSLSPINPTLNVGQTLSLTATASFDDGTQQVLQQATGVAAGSSHTCAVAANGTVSCWGYNVYGQLGNGTTTNANTPVTVSGITTAVAVSAGSYNTCTVLINGAVLCWGYNAYGGLGNGTTTNSSTPVTVSGISTAVAVSAGNSHTCAMLTDGSVLCWGKNTEGELGNGTMVNSSIPVTVIGISAATAIDAGDRHTCARLASGAMQCWGDNLNGQLGNGTMVNSSIPVTVSGIATAVSVNAGNSHTCAALTNGTAQCWGYNNFGQLGNGTTTTSTLPVTVSGISNATALAAGYQHSCARLASGSMQCWGDNNSGQLGDGSMTTSSIPVTVIGISAATAIAAGASHTCAVLASGAMQCWGYNNYGQVGNGVTVDMVALSPVAVSSINSASTLAAASNFNCVVIADGTVQCWGSNASGQLGNGTTTNSNIPVTVSGITTAVAVSVLGSYNAYFPGSIYGGQGNACALLTDGTVRCWGYGISVPITVNGITNAVALSKNCAVLSDGTVSCWTLSSGSASVPVTVSGISTAVAFSQGDSHACAILVDGTVHCWGSIQITATPIGAPSYTIYGVTYDPAVAIGGITNAVAVSAGGFNTYAVLSDGRVQCWGHNCSGNGTVINSDAPVTVSSISTAVAVSNYSKSDAGNSYAGIPADTYHVCTSLAGGTVQCWGQNSLGELGNGTTTTSNVPVTVSGISTAVMVGAGQNHSCAELSNGTLQCWGSRGYGQLGDGASQKIFVPVSTRGYYPLTWSSSDPGVASVDAVGRVTGIMLGTATIAVSDGTFNTSGTVSVNGVQTYSLTIITQGNGSGSVSGAGIYNHGQTATVTATANNGSAFSGWSGANAAECATGSVLMNANKSCTATFTLETHTLSLLTAGNGSGIVSGAGIYDYGTNATVTAAASTGSTFSGWSGPDGAACTIGSVLMDADKSCTATFTSLSTADLTPTALTASQSGAKVSVKDTAKNQGSSKITKAFTVGYYLSTDKVYQAGTDIALASSSSGSGVCTRSITSLGAGSSNSGSKSCYKPTAAKKGVNYYVLVVDDAGGVITESNETNNARSTTNTVRW